MAVYTDVSDAALTAFLTEYDLGEPLSCKGIAEGVENSNFLLRTRAGSFILTLYEKRVDPADLPFFVGLMDHLSARGLNCPTPIRGRDGEALRKLCGRPAAIISFLEGLWPRRIEPFHCAGVGAALAHLHAAGADFPMPRKNSLSVEGWRRLIEAIGPRAEEVQPGLAAEIAGEFEDLAAHWPQDLPAGICHADLFPDNVFFRDEAVTGLIDFYFACTDAWAYDLAICLNAWCFDVSESGLDHRFNAEKARLLTSAYAAVRPLCEAERAALPVFARGSALRFLLTRLYDWLNRQPGALVRPKDPLEYLAKLRFHRSVGDAGRYGL